MPAAKVALAPITKTVMRRRITRSGMTRPECWEAVTADGAWVFERIEDTGTPWIIRHHETGIAVNLGGTLRGCRAHVAAGHAQADLDRLQAHDRGEHDGARDSYCGRC